jgi:hypothetical protein
MVTLGALIINHYHELDEKYCDELHSQLEILIKMGSTIINNNFEIGSLGPLGICVVDRSKLSSDIYNSYSSLCEWPLVDAWNIVVDIENWQEEPLPPVIKKNTVSENTVLKLILQEYNNRMNTIQIFQFGQCSFYLH